MRVNSGGGEAEYDKLLFEFGETAVREPFDVTAYDRVKEKVIAKYSEHGYVDACAISAMFCAITKIVDTTGHK